MEEKVVFICGFPSGGTTLTRSVLNSHESVYLSPEMHFLYHLEKDGYSAETIFDSPEKLQAFKEYLKSKDEFKACQGIENAVRVDMDNPLKLKDVLRAWFKKDHAVVWGNKTPQNTENIYELDRLFPGALFLVVCRDVRETALSCSQKWGRSLPLTAFKWSERLASALEAQERLGSERVMLFKFEDLLNDPESTGKSICDFIGIDFSTKMLSPEVYGVKSMDGMRNSGEVIKASNQDKWRKKLSENQIEQMESLSFDVMLRLGYEPEFASSQVKLGFLRKVQLYLHDAIKTFSHGNAYSKKNTLKNRVSDSFYLLKNLVSRLK